MKQIYSLLLVMLIGIAAFSQDTFSIIALDTVTGEIGGAGASCIDDGAIAGGVLIINDIIPGRGGIHTQSYWVSANQVNAHNRMLEGMSPQEIIDWLVANDVQNNPGIRQYGIVDFDSAGNPRSAGFTGSNCFDYKNHVLGPNYAIQGNILLGQEILDSIESRFLNTQGSLAVKLMAALQGANVPGADTRCMNEGTSSLSAFIRVAMPSDTNGTFYCDLAVTSTPYGVEPIDSLQVLFDAWLNWTGMRSNLNYNSEVVLFPNPGNTVVNLKIKDADPSARYSMVLTDMQGRSLKYYPEIMPETQLDIAGLENGLYFYTLFSNNQPFHSGKLIVHQ